MTPFLKGYAVDTVDVEETPAHLHYARSIVQKLHAHDATSSYGYANRMGMHEGDKPHYEFTCYGFLDFVLSKACPRALEDLLALRKSCFSDLPLSFDGKILPYHLVMLGERLDQPTQHVESVRDIRSIQRGDIVSYMDYGYTLLKDPPPLSQKTGTHVMIIDHVVDVIEDENGVSTTFWIIDATRSPHNRRDSRYHKNPAFRKNGIGTSPFILRQHKSLRTWSIQWSGGGKSYEKIISIVRFSF